MAGSSAGGIPDVVGYLLDDALKALSSAGVQRVEEIEAAPPWGYRSPGPRRVVRQRALESGTVELVTVCEQHELARGNRTPSRRGF